MLFLFCFNRLLLFFELQCLHQLLLILVVRLFTFFFILLHFIFLFLDLSSEFLIDFFLFPYLFDLADFLDGFLEMALLYFFVLKLDFPQVFRLAWLLFWNFIFSFFNLRVPSRGLIFILSLILGNLKCSFLSFLKDAFESRGFLPLRWFALIVLVSNLVSVEKALCWLFLSTGVFDFWLPFFGYLLI